MKRWLVWALVLLAAVAGTFGVRILAKQLAFFSVRRIELAGARYLTVSEVAAALAVPEGTSVFDDTRPWTERAAALGGVLEAKVSRRLPGTFRVTIREAEPIALAERGGRLVLVDSAGKVLPFDPTHPAADLPLAEADSAVAGLLARVRESNPDLFARIQRGVRVQRDIALELDAGRVLLRSGASVDAIRDVSLVADVLARQGRRWRELDGRFSPRVIVRPGGGGA